MVAKRGMILGRGAIRGEAYVEIVVVCGDEMVVMFRALDRVKELRKRNCWRSRTEGYYYFK